MLLVLETAATECLLLKLLLGRVFVNADDTGDTGDTECRFTGTCTRFPDKVAPP